MPNYHERFRQFTDKFKKTFEDPSTKVQSVGAAMILSGIMFLARGINIDSNIEQQIANITLPFPSAQSMPLFDAQSAVYVYEDQVRIAALNRQNIVVTPYIQQSYQRIANENTISFEKNQLKSAEFTDLQIIGGFFTAWTGFSIITVNYLLNKKNNDDDQENGSGGSDGGDDPNGGEDPNSDRGLNYKEVLAEAEELLNLPAVRQ